ncbi:stress-activated map kinase-interacting protein 1 [Wyeomyia smithii]|uniref:stress-activated map kinase-interacting protein 1 n=1 Tax=Wyeomyia smithii TaxID=174621 RepID=UPI002467EBA0|nr:stress-activated map kinase-interacting protein 1 [Wyeomyia smithii]XP_055540890.1 stress-activated map kinase-interacting protein 1 [Wyeomyia smithii]
MATYNNPHWLLSHIRNSFISTDDTGLSETVMMLEDIPAQYAQLHKQAAQSASEELSETPREEARLPEPLLSYSDFYCYPGLEDSDDDEADSLSQSYEIQMDQEVGFHRQRSNTDQKLERLEIARRKAARIKNIKYETAVQQGDEGDDELFVRKQVKLVDEEKRTSMLTKQLETYPIMPQNKFLEYAKYDGTSQTEVPTKMFKIFLGMMPEEQQRAYPVSVCVTATAKIQDFIGLICYKCSLVYPDVSLRSVRHYGLFMTEEDGEIDLDFPALDVNEQCSKFCFTHLAIAERKPPELQAQTSLSGSSVVRSDLRTRSITSELGEPSWQSAYRTEESSAADTKMLTPQQKKDLDKMQGHTSKLEAPQYRSFQVFIIHKARLKTEVQLGISGDKLEIDPVQPKSTAKFWPRQKSANHSMDSIAHCSMVERKTSKATLRIVYSATSYPQGLSASTGTDFVMSSPTIRQQQASGQTSALFKHYDIETDPATAQEIVEKINNILEVRSSPVRREYIASRSAR